MSGKIIICLITITCMTIILSGCSTSSFKSTVKNVAKNDIDRVADTSVKILSDLLLEITLELYRLNPDELSKVSSMNLQSRTTQIVEYPTAVAYKELDYKQDIEAIRLALDPSYRGDRVFALMLGVSSMIDISYNNQKEFFVLDQLDPQKLYDTSTNLDLLHRTLSKQDKENSLLITSDKQQPHKIYILLSKMSAVQEFTADIVAGKAGRIINKTLHGIATVFLPIGI